MSLIAEYISKAILQTILLDKKKPLRVSCKFQLLSRYIHNEVHKKLDEKQKKRKMECKFRHIKYNRMYFIISSALKDNMACVIFTLRVLSNLILFLLFTFLETFLKGKCFIVLNVQTFCLKIG